MSTALAATALAIAATYLLLRLTWSWQTDLRTRSNERPVVPPGPTQWPIIGNIGQVNPLRQHPKFFEWARKYGSIYRVRFGSNNFVVLNTAQAVVDLFDRRSAIYSSRAGPHFAHDLMSMGQRMVFLDYGKEWKAVRASLHPYLMGTQSVRYRPVQEYESAVLMGDLARHTRLRARAGPRPAGTELTHENNWEAHVRRYTTSIVMNITYGHRVSKTEGNKSLHKIYEALANFTKVGQPGRNACDDFPIIRHLPDFLAPWRKEALKLHAWEMELWGGFLEELKEERRKGTARPSYANDVLQKREEAEASFDGKGLGLVDGKMTDLLLAYAAATVLEAGSDTTASSVYFFVLAALNDPPMFAKLQEEIDAKVPRTRLPMFEDIADLPYLRACVKETLRRRPPTIMGIPHKVTQDDVYDGFFIKKDSICIGNVWAIHMDPERYPEPERFRPERFLDDNLSAAESAATLDATRRDHHAFGWGRRVCQGMHIAEASLRIILARIAWAFELSPEPGASIPPISDEKSFSDGFVSQTLAFPVRFTPRDTGVDGILSRAYDEAQLFWATEGLEGDERDLRV